MYTIRKDIVQDSIPNETFSSDFQEGLPLRRGSTDLVEGATFLPSHAGYSAHAGGGLKRTISRVRMVV